MSDSGLLVQASAVSIGGRGLMIEGTPGSGKSSLALALLDRGAQLIGDDGVRLQLEDGELVACPPPNITGKLEIRGVGIVDVTPCRAPLCLILSLADHAARLPDPLEQRDMLGIAIPVLPFQASDPIQALRAEWALAVHGRPITKPLSH